MKYYMLVAIFLFGLALTGCYSDNFVVKSVNVTEKSFTFEWMYRGDLMFTNVGNQYLRNEFDIDDECLGKIQIGKKFPDCMLPSIKHFAFPKDNINIK